MPRIIFKNGKQSEFLRKIKSASKLSNDKLGVIAERSGHTIGEWLYEKSAIDERCALILSKKFSISVPTDVRILPDYWHVKQAGRLGALARMKRHGNLGTPKGRRLGGLNSIIAHNKIKSAFKVRKKIIQPQYSRKLAEFIGIIIGDGGLTYHQVTVTLNKKTDALYGEWICGMVKGLFGLDVIRRLRADNTLQLTITGINLVEYLLDKGLNRGNKIKNKIRIPGWIRKNREYSLSCVRGLFDTDGCVYIDKHIYKKKIYKNICLDFTSASPALINDVYYILTHEGLNFKKYGKSIKLRKEDEIKKYIRIIGTHNPKHDKKFNIFFKDKPGEVA